MEKNFLKKGELSHLFPASLVCVLLFLSSSGMCRASCDNSTNSVPSLGDCVSLIAYYTFYDARNYLWNSDDNTILWYYHVTDIIMTHVLHTAMKPFTFSLESSQKSNTPSKMQLTWKHIIQNVQWVRSCSFCYQPTSQLQEQDCHTVDYRPLNHILRVIASWAFCQLMEMWIFWELSFEAVFKIRSSPSPSAPLRPLTPIKRHRMCHLVIILLPTFK